MVKSVFRSEPLSKLVNAASLIYVKSGSGHQLWRLGVEIVKIPTAEFQRSLY